VKRRTTTLPRCRSRFCPRMLLRTWWSAKPRVFESAQFEDLANTGVIFGSQKSDEVSLSDLVDSITQWSSTKRNSTAERSRKDNTSELVIERGRYSLVPRSRQEIIDLALNDCRMCCRLFAAQAREGTVVKENFGTFSPAPGSDSGAPPRKVRWRTIPRGDWTLRAGRRQWEGAVRERVPRRRSDSLSNGCAAEFLARPDSPGGPRLLGSILDQ